MADMQAFEYLCRICASDTKGKSSVAECVYVLKTNHLKEKIKKYLDLTVSEDDALPKVICKSCYRSVEGIVSLSKIAVHTQMVLSNFLKPHSALIEPESEFTSIVSPVKDYDRSYGSTAATAATAAAAVTTATPPVATQTTREKPKRSEEVVVNVSVSDPLTRETQQKIIGASRQRQTLLDSRFIPKSIAHRHVSFATSTPKDNLHETANLNFSKKNTTITQPSAGGVINFFNPQQPQQQVTVTSGGYVIGQMNGSTLTNSSSSTNVKAQQVNESEQQKRKNFKMTHKGMRGSNVGQVSLLKVSQKPSSLIVNPSLSDNSLLDSPAQPPPPSQPYGRTRALSPPMRKTRKPPQRRPTIAEIPSTVEALPREIIIASVKKPKQRNQTTTTATATTNQTTTLPQLGPPPQLQPKPSEPRQNSAAEAIMQPGIPKSLFPDDVPLGRVIRDFDLLKLIMKALKWTVTSENFELQLERLRNSKFTTIMSDPILLHDTDLTQLLGPYLTPVLMAAQTLQQQQNVTATIVSSPNTPKSLKSTPPAAAETPADLSATDTSNLASAIPYRLPPETSVQLVPASPEEERTVVKTNQHNSRKSSSSSNKRSRRPIDSPRRRDFSIVISDGEEDDPSSGSRSSNNKHKQKEKFSKTNLINDDISSYDALKQLAERSRAALERVAPPLATQRSRSGAESANMPATPPPPAIYPSFVDDIVLIEPEPSQTVRSSPKAQESLPTVISMTSPDNLFQARALPPITRPIIKRRKTVIHSSPAKSAFQINKPIKPTTGAIAEMVMLSSNSSKREKTENPAVAIQVPSNITTANDVQKAAAYPKMANVAAGTDIKKISVATSMSFFDGVTTHITAATVSTATSTAAATVTASAAAAASAAVTANPQLAASVKDAKEPTKKPLSSKHALAEQLLEAVGLKKSNSTALDKVPSRESVQQIRSALKRSLKQAVEQNQRKQEELPVKQIADSTTINLAKEAAKVPEPVDIEDEIAKVTLQKTDHQLNLFNSRPQETSKSRNANRQPRKPANQMSVIKNSTGILSDKEATVDDEPKPEHTKLMPESKKSTFSQTSPPPCSHTDILNSASSSGHAVTSTSESKAVEESKTNEELKTTSEISIQVNKKKGRKRKVLEEIGGDITDASDDTKKKEPKSENDNKSIAGGDSEIVKETTSATETDRKPEASGSSSARPSRASKTSSRYYKGPDKPVSTRPTRSTRNK